MGVPRPFLAMDLCGYCLWSPRFACYICLSRCGAGRRGFPWVVGHCQLSGTERGCSQGKWCKME